MEFKVTLEMPGMKTSFTTNDEKSTLRAFEKKDILILNKPNGDKFAIRTEDFSYIAIDAISEQDVSCTKDEVKG